MTWRRRRKYVEITDSLSLTANWISRIHYLTLESMEHAGILHQLALFLSFPDLQAEDYSLRRTGNTQIEAFHSILHGRVAHLPITSANLTFRDFLCQMNKAMQIKNAENTLEKVSGNSIQNSKKRKITFAPSSNDATLNTTDTYQKPSKYEDFVAELISACKSGDNDSKKLMQELVPHLAHKLRKSKQWENPSHCLLNSIESIKLVASEADFDDVCTAENIFDTLVSAHLDKTMKDISEELELLEDNDENGYVLSVPHHDQAVQENTIEAVCNLISDVNMDTIDQHSANASSLLRDLQPHKEKPSKDRSRRFHCGGLFGDQATPANHDVSSFDFWAIHPSKNLLRKLRYFLIGK